MSMSNADTATGGLEREFPSTVWSDILAAGDPKNPNHRARLSGLVQAYWKPVYAYVRTAWRTSIEDSKDLTQAFFAHLLDKGYLGSLRADRGSFRGYLKKALKHFLIDAGRAAQARRPEGPVVSLEAMPKVLERLAPASPNESPEQVYDREWLRCLLHS